MGRGQAQERSVGREGCQPARFASTESPLQSEDRAIFKVEIESKMDNKYIVDITDAEEITLRGCFFLALAVETIGKLRAVID